MLIEKEKICIECSAELCEDNWIFISDKYKHKHYICDVCRKNNASKYRKSNKEQIADMNKKYRFSLRVDVIGHYGGKCEKCQENDLNFLTIDHINNDGNIDRNIKKLGSGHNFYRYLKKNGYPEGFRVLCFNCNCSASVCADHINTSPKYQIRKIELKQKVINAYGSQCNNCGHTVKNHLTIDHIYGATEEDKDIRSSLRLYRYLEINDFPKDKFQLLCYNCNCAKQYFGYTKQKEINV